MSIQDIHEIKEGIRDIVFLLKGNPLNEKDKGMLGEILNIRERVVVIEEERKRFRWTMKVVIAVGTGLGAVIGFVLKYFIH